MREIMIALSNTVRMLDIQLDIINHDIEMLDDIIEIDNGRLDIKLEKCYKHVIRLKLIEYKKSFLDTIALQRKAEKE